MLERRENFPGGMNLGTLAHMTLQTNLRGASMKRIISLPCRHSVRLPWLGAVLVAILLSAVTTALADPILTPVIVVETPDIPRITGKLSRTVGTFEIAEFQFPVEGIVASATMEGWWGGKRIQKIAKLDLYLGDELLMDFGQYYKSLKKAQKRDLK